MEQVPQVYCREAEPQPQEEELLAQERLLLPLEYFLFGEEPHVGREKLQQRGGTTSQLCGRVFKEGETVYSCRWETHQPVSLTEGVACMKPLIPVIVATHSNFCVRQVSAPYGWVMWLIICIFYQECIITRLYIMLLNVLLTSVGLPNILWSDISWKRTIVKYNRPLSRALKLDIAITN